MKEQPSLINASITSYVGFQVVLLGLMFMCIGLILGINIVGVPAYAHIQMQTPIDVIATPPDYLKRAGLINNVAVVTTVISLAGLIGLDYVGKSD